MGAEADTHRNAEAGNWERIVGKGEDFQLEDKTSHKGGLAATQQLEGYQGYGRYGSEKTLHRFRGSCPKEPGKCERWS